MVVLSNRSSRAYTFTESKKKMCVRTAAYTGLAIAILAVLLAIGAYWFPGCHGCDGNGNGNGDGNGPCRRTTSLLSLYDNRTQVLLLTPQLQPIWTNIRFNNQLLTTSAWTHNVGVSDSIITAKRACRFTVYISIQAQIIGATPGTVVAPACKPCNLRYLLRATQQLFGNDTIDEVAGSLTYSSGHNFFLSKQFFIEARPGDIFRFQFSSLCKDLSLYPLPFVQVNDPVTLSGSHPASATLLISS